eukprot:912173-Rhodomonas_salina.1
MLRLRVLQRPGTEFRAFATRLAWHCGPRSTSAAPTSSPSTPKARYPPSPNGPVRCENLLSLTWATLSISS